jgi:hypothetical protein
MWVKEKSLNLKKSFVIIGMAGPVSCYVPMWGTSIGHGSIEHSKEQPEGVQIQWSWEHGSAREVHHLLSFLILLHQSWKENRTGGTMEVSECTAHTSSLNARHSSPSQLCTNQPTNQPKKKNPIQYFAFSSVCEVGCQEHECSTGKVILGCRKELHRRKHDIQNTDIFFLLITPVSLKVCPREVFTLIKKL